MDQLPTCLSSSSFQNSSTHPHHASSFHGRGRRRNNETGTASWPTKMLLRHHRRLHHPSLSPSLNTTEMEIEQRDNNRLLLARDTASTYVFDFACTTMQATQRKQRASFIRSCDEFVMMVVMTIFMLGLVELRGWLDRGARGGVCVCVCDRSINGCTGRRAPSCPRQCRPGSRPAGTPGYRCRSGARPPTP